ncbi:MAG: sensor histidine kinase [Parafilimonas sp.]
MGHIMHSTQTEILSTIIIIASVFLGVIIFYMIYTFRKQHRKIVAWQEARIKAEIDTLENERRRIAADLHDDIGPMLSAIKLHINHVEPVNEEEKIIIERSGKLMDEVIHRFRGIAYDLLPNTLIRKGLIKAIPEFISKINEAHNLKINFIHDEDIQLPAESELNLYRIVQEIIHNTIKHARATELTITLQKKEKQLVCTTADNGKGFYYDGINISDAAGLGLLNIQNRVTLLNGNLTIKSENLKGTNYFILIPLENDD